MYEGKATEAEKTRIRSQYGDIGAATAVLLDLSKDYFGTGRNITADNFFGSKEAAGELMKRRLTGVFTMRKQRREIPREITEARGQELHSSKFFFSDNCMLVAYKTKPRKVVLALSSFHLNPLVSTTEPRKPQIILHYNGTKGQLVKLG